MTPWGTGSASREIQAPEAPLQGGVPRTGIIHATRAYIEERSIFMDDVVCGDMGNGLVRRYALADVGLANPSTGRKTAGRK